MDRGETLMKMYKSVFKYPQYGMTTHFKNVEDFKKHKSARKGVNADSREALRAKRRQELADARLQALRAAHAAVIKYANQATEATRKKKNTHPRHLREK